MCVHIFKISDTLLLLGQMTTSLLAQNNAIFLPSHTGGQKSEVGLIKLKSRCTQGFVPSGGSRENLCPCFFHLLEVTCISWLLAPFFHLKRQRPKTFSCLSASGSLVSLFCSKDACDYIWIIQDNLFILRSLTRNPNSICNPNYSLPHNTTYSQVPGIGMWTS